MSMEEFIKLLQENPELCTRIELCETPGELQEIASEYHVNPEELEAVLAQLA